MDEKIYKITLSDGTEIPDLHLNGNNFISDIPIIESMFVDNCSPVIISDEEKEEIHDHMGLVQITYNPETCEYWFVLRDLTAGELKQIKMQSDIEYLAMMTGVEM